MATSLAPIEDIVQFSTAAQTAQVNSPVPAPHIAVATATTDVPQLRPFNHSPFPTEEIEKLWRDFKADPDSQPLRNRLVEQYLPLVKYNGERIWSRLPEGVELDDL